MDKTLQLAIDALEADEYPVFLDADDFRSGKNP
jgi:hypothetical protein